MKRFAVRGVGGLLLNLLLVPFASAQTPAAPVSGFVSANIGMAQPTPGALTSIAAVSDGSNREEVRLTGTMRSAPVVDIGGGVLIRNRWIVGVAYDRTAASAPSEIALTLQHPDSHPTLTASTATEALERIEEGTHFSGGMRIPIARAFSLTLFGGPSYLTRQQQLLDGIFFGERFDPATRTSAAVINSFETKTVRSSAWGYHVGADGSYFLSRHVGIGAQLRYSRATFETDNLLQSDLEGRTVTDLAKGGGLRLAAGVRVRF